MKKYLLGLSIICLIVSGFFLAYGYDYEKTLPYDDFAGKDNVELQSNPITNFSGVMKKDIINNGQEQGSSYFDDFLQLLGIHKFIRTNYDPRGEGVAENANPNNAHAANRYVVRLINYGIGMMGVVALMFLIYGFFTMLFAKDDEGYTKAKKIVINAAIAIAVVAFSRMITTFIVYFYDKVSTKQNNTTTESTQTTIYQP